MKFKLLILLLTLLNTTYVSAQGKIYAIHTNSLTCDYCAYDLEQKFMSMEGVKAFDVDTDGILFVKTDNSLRLDRTLVRKLLLDNGFDYNGMTEKNNE